MKIVRSILGVLVGGVLALAVIFGIEIAHFVANAPAGENSPFEKMMELHEDKPAMKAWLQASPASSLVTVLLAWQAGAFVGGCGCALIAGRGRLVHAGIIGVLVLGETIFNFLDMKAKFDFSHPDWMIIAGLLLPIPVSLLAGKLVSMLFPAPPTPVPPS